MRGAVVQRQRQPEVRILVFEFRSKYKTQRITQVVAGEGGLILIFNLDSLLAVGWASFSSDLAQPELR